MSNHSMGFEDIIRKLSAGDNAENDDKSSKNFNNNTYKALISYIISLPPKQYTLLSTLIGLLLIDNLDAKDQILLGKFINNIGQTIITSAAQEQITIKKDKHHDNS
jgi:hypothetical protein